MNLSPIRIAAGGLLVAAYTTMVFGAYVKAIGAGMACPDWPTCIDGRIVTLDSSGLAAEGLHRVAATSVVLFGLALLFFEFTQHRDQKALLLTTLITAGLVGIQIVLGALTIFSTLAPVIVTAHLATATLVFGFSLVIALRVWKLPPPSAIVPEKAAAKEPEATKTG